MPEAGEPSSRTWAPDAGGPLALTQFPEDEPQQPLPPLELNQSFPFATGFEDERPPHVEPAADEPFVLEDEPLVEALDPPPPAAYEAASTPVTAAASVPPAIRRPGTRVGPRQVAMMGAALFATGGLIFTIMGMRPSASPEAVPSATPAPAPARSVPNRAPAAARTSAVATAAGPRWSEVTGGRWTGGDKKSAAFELPALNRIRIWTRDVTPVLVVRCHAGRVEPFVYTQSAARMEPQDGDHTVRLAFDDGAEVTERWPDSDEHDALFARDAAAFTAQLVSAQTLRFGFEPHNASPAVARFQVSGLGERLSAAKPCGGKR